MSSSVGTTTVVYASVVTAVIALIFRCGPRAMTMRSVRCVVDKSLRSRVALVTGASSGLGERISQEFVRRKIDVVFLGNRSESKTAAAVGRIRRNCPQTETSLEYIHLDLTSLQALDAFVHALKDSIGSKKIDILVNNAGIMNAPYGLTADGLESHFGVNHIAHFHLTNLLLKADLLSPTARILLVSSGYAKKSDAPTRDLWMEKVGDEATYKPLTAYARSKLANILHGVALAERLDQGMSVYSIRPGFVRGTDLGRHHNKFLIMLAYPLIRLFSRSIEDGVQTYLHCALSDELQNGACYYNCAVESANPDVVNAETASVLWDASEEIVERVVAGWR